MMGASSRNKKVLGPSCSRVLTQRRQDDVRKFLGAEVNWAWVPALSLNGLWKFALRKESPGCGAARVLLRPERLS